MIHVYKSGNRYHIILLIILFVGIASLLSTGCKSPESPDTGEPESVAVITITNDYGEILDIYLDGVFQFMLDNDESQDIEDISLGQHRLEAKRTGTDEVLDWYDFEITQVGDYLWTVDDPPDINVINGSGIKLKIFMNGLYQFDLEDEENRWILNVSRTEHLLRADKAVDDTEYASTTIEVIQNKDYTWEIN